VKTSLLFLLAIGACAPTQVVVFVDTSLGVPCEIDEVAFDVNGDMNVDRKGTLSGGPISLTLVQSGGGDYDTVHIYGRKNGTDVVAATATIRWTSGQSESMWVTLKPECTPTSPCTFDTSQIQKGISAPEPSARSFCSAGYSMSTRMPAPYPNDPLVKNACNLGTLANFATLSFTANGTCQVSQKACTSNADCSTESPAVCMFGEVPIPDTIVTAFKNTGYNFAGAAIPGMWIGQDGYLVFTDSRPNKTSAQIGLNTSLDKAATPAPAVMPFWNDLKPQSLKQACVALASDNTLWVTWNSCFTADNSGTTCTSSDMLTFTVGLQSVDNVVRFGYITMSSSADGPDALGNSAAIGVREALAPGCTPDQCDAASGKCKDGVTPCGYTQASYRMAVPASMPLTSTSFVFTPNDPK
jgi:hypothetical protein